MWKSSVPDRRRTLVTGGLGFVGSHLVEKLAARGEDVTVVDNVSTPAVRPETLAGICTIHIGDAAELSAGDGPFEHVYHLADIAGPARVVEHGGEIAHLAVSNARAVLRAARAWRARVLIVSSSEVYGRTGTFDEHDDLIIPASYTARLEYAVGKSLVEIAAMNAVRRHDLSVNIVRPFNIAGPRQRSLGGFVIPRFFEAALARRPIEIFDGGAQERAFCHVLDTVDSLVTVMDSGCSAETFNTGNADNRIEIGALAQWIRDLTGSDSPIVHRDGTDVFGPLYAESFNKLPNIAKIKARTGWRPVRPLAQMLSDVHESMSRARSVA
jgi:UDP-glucose 4-epimerase